MSFKKVPSNFVLLEDLPERRVVLNFDGTVNPVNPGGIAVGSWVIRDQFGNLVSKGGKEACRGTGSTNNVAEWAGLAYGLEDLAAIGWDGAVEVIGDSELVINQITGRQMVIKFHLQEWHVKVEKLISQWVWHARHVLRKFNTEADAIGQEVYKTLPPFDPGILEESHWYNDPASKKQIKLLRNLGYQDSCEGLTKRQAFNIINDLKLKLRKS